MAACVRSPDSATSRAAPAVSPDITGVRPCSRITLRHWPSACTWLCTVRIESSDGAGQRHQRELDAQEVLADDVQARVRQEVVDVGDPARDRVVDRDHRELGVPALDGGEDVLEGGARHRFPVGVVQVADHVGVGSRLALVGDPSVEALTVGVSHVGRRARSPRAGGYYSRPRADLPGPPCAARRGLAALGVAVAGRRTTRRGRGGRRRATFPRTRGPCGRRSRR